MKIITFYALYVVTNLLAVSREWTLELDLSHKMS